METFQAGTFNFYIGPDMVHFILYKNLVSRYSEPLGSMMTNGMKESQEGAAYLEHVDPETFCRFAEFIHSSDYSAAAPIEDPTPAPVEDTAPPPEDDDWGGFALSSPKKKKKRKSRAILWDVPVIDGGEQPPPVLEEVYQESAAQDRVEVADSPPTSPPMPPPPPPPLPFLVEPAPGLNRSPSMNYTQTFACHISVYHFAETYLVWGLKELAEQKLSEALEGFQCFPERTGDICHITRLVYNHEDGDTHPSPLHSIISDYATNNFNTLTASKNFKDLLAEGGSFPPDVCSKVARLLD
ncbi:hypothetical protein SLS58_007155 [Diplodia intermedia]|uniref:BTB domain-containing protein n=1 Tax=Diplodia intermedia TaxID=856260 RepID=A0ABR3TKY9_9PEZI